MQEKMLVIEGSILCPCFLLVACCVECQNEVKVEGWKPVHSGKVLAQWVGPVHLLFQENAMQPHPEQVAYPSPDHRNPWPTPAWSGLNFSLFSNLLATEDYISQDALPLVNLSILTAKLNASAGNFLTESFVGDDISLWKCHFWQIRVFRWKKLLVDISWPV